MEYLSSIVTKLQGLHPLLLTGLAIGSDIPSTKLGRQDPIRATFDIFLKCALHVGSTLPLLSLIGKREFVRNTPNVVAIGMQKVSLRIIICAVVGK